MRLLFFVIERTGKSISESQAVDNSQVTKMLEELSKTGKKLIELLMVKSKIRGD